MRPIRLAAAIALAPAAAFAAAPAPTEGPVPQGKLPDVATPTAYRLDLTVLPDQDRFSGHAEIDVTLKKPTRSLYMHGRDLKVTTALARVAGASMPISYTQVDPLGVVRLDFPKTLPAGRVTLAFDYTAPFGNGPSGLYHIKVGDQWYAWTQFESIDARAAYPGFDQPGYKTPFTVTLTTAPGFTAVSNAQETGTVKAGKLVKHVFAPTKPLPTYLIAFAVGPFVIASGSAAPDAERKEPLPVRVVATQANKDKLQFALDNTGPIVDLLEKYFGRPFPFPKLDQIASPVMPGAMENAGADIYGDNIIMLDPDASTANKQEFGMVVAHELSHQWFGDLVTPEWWDDIWLNESFANWMGYRIGNEWRPDLKIGAGAIAEAFAAMNTDALAAGRPIHQPIRTNGEIDSAFDAVTYGKGGQVVAMIAAYMGDAKFREGVRLHLNRHAYGNATTDQFFQSLADAARDPRVLNAMRSFVDQQGVPVVRVERVGGGLKVSQKRYTMLGTEAPAESWTIPLCMRVGGDRQCTLLDKSSAVVPMKGNGPIMPNAGGTGYYRFALSPADWKPLIADAASLPPGEALAATDSLWAGFRAGELDPALLVTMAKAMAANPYSGAATDGGERLEGLRVRGMIPDAELPAYRKLIDGIYTPKLARLGFDPKAGVYAKEDPDTQHLRSDMVSLLAGEARDPAVLAKLDAAATAYLGGDKTALDQSMLGSALAAHVSKGGETAASALFAKAVASDDSLFRSAALNAVSGSGDAGIGRWIIQHLDDKGLRVTEKIGLLRGLMSEPATRAIGFDALKTRFDSFVKDAGIFTVSGLLTMPSYFCSVEDAKAIEAAFGPKVAAYKRGALPLARTVERVHDCGVLEQEKGAAIARAIGGE